MPFLINGKPVSPILGVRSGSFLQPSSKVLVAPLTGSQSQGPNNPTAYEAYGLGSSWVNLSNILTSDNSYAYSDITSSDDYARRLLLSDFGFAIPYGATIDGIEVSVEAYSINGVMLADINYPLKIGSLGQAEPGIGTEKGYLAELQTISDTEQIYIFGGPSNKWNNWSDYPLTSDDINDPNFAIELTFTPDFTGEIYVDNVTMKVYFFSTADVTPDPVSWADLYYNDGIGGNGFNISKRQITGISTPITIKISADPSTVDLYYLVSNSISPPADEAAYNSFPEDYGLSSIANNGTFNISNNQYLSLAITSASSGNGTITLTNVSDNDAVLDTINYTLTVS